MKAKKACDLCGLAVEIGGFDLHTTEGEKVFCCEGCKGIYQMLHEDTILESSDDVVKQIND
ncbi:MAG: heavy metal translocating P-type ATPase metal-binding domain-containing protein [Methylovulum sp.]|nr:heavy metal translocating P-type ATPase metal-binding domain-containing protein [Methylovulum sp.]